MDRRLKNSIVICTSLTVVGTAALYCLAASEDEHGLVNSCKHFILEHGSTYVVFCFSALVAAVAMVFIGYCKRRSAYAIIALTFLVLSSLALAFPHQTKWCANYFAPERIRERHSLKLQIELNKLSEFENVDLKYSYWPHSKGEQLTVLGNVSDLNAYEKLVKRIENADNWFVDWAVKIDGRTPDASY